MAKKKENKPPTLNERIENAVNLGPLTPLYFVVAIDMLKIISTVRKTSR